MTVAQSCRCLGRGPNDAQQEAGVQSDSSRLIIASQMPLALRWAAGTSALLTRIGHCINGAGINLTSLVFALPLGTCPAHDAVAPPL